MPALRTPRTQDRRDDRKKLITVLLVLFLAIGWIVWSQFLVTGRPPTPSPAEAARLQQAHDAELQGIKAAQPKAHGALKSPSGA